MSRAHSKAKVPKGEHVESIDLGSLTWTELSEFIGAAGAPEGEGRTAEEIGRHFGRSGAWARCLLRRLHGRGMIVVHRRRTEGIDGRTYWTPVYQSRPESAGDAQARE